VTRHADVLEVLHRDQDFTITEVNSPAINRWSGLFILGMDRGEMYDREVGALRRAAPPEDLPRIRAFAASTAAELVDSVAPVGRIDVVADFARVVPTRLVADYFGVPGPDEASMMRWMRAMFDAVFIDNGPRAAKAAELTVAEQRPYMQELIRARRAAIDAGEAVPDDMLTRLVAMGTTQPWLDDDAVRRNINGIIVGAVDTTSKAVTHVIDELLRRPQALEGAHHAAVAGDIDAVRGYAWEALRFLPQTSFLQRFSPRDTAVGGRKQPIRAGSVVLVAVLSAMFDEDAVPEPGRFRSDRPEDHYLHFGHGMHTCFGRAINAVQIPEMVAALVRLPNLRRAPGRAGTLAYDGPFPDHLVVEFGQRG